MIRIILLILMGALSVLRIKDEYLILKSLVDSGVASSDFFLGLLSLLIYIIPVTFMVYFLAKRYKLRLRYFIISLFFGSFLISHWSGIVNIKFYDFLANIINNKNFMDVWGPSIVPVLIEEVFKLGLSLLIIYIFNIKDIFNILLIGIGVGLGFQISEDYTYILAGLIESKNVLTEAFSRFTTAFAGHWLLNAFLTTGVGYLLFYKKKRKEFISYFWIILAFVLHAVWNSIYLEKHPILAFILNPLSWALLFKLLKDIDKLYKSSKSHADIKR